MNLEVATYVTFLAPLVGFLLIALGGSTLPARVAGMIGCGAVLAAFGGAVAAVLAWQGLDHPERGELFTPWRWLTAGSFDVGVDLFVDPLALWMMAIVTGVGFLIHVYSLGYMAGDPQFRRFFAYLNLFIFAMLTLVMAGNLVFLLIGWGLVGMASYLLIGFWHDRPIAVAAAKKAFIVNAIGDVSILLGLLLVFRETAAISYPDVFDRIGRSVAAESGLAFTICMLLLGGCLAKSAQLPLHTWLPDAMEGPTPVSALIHAATMVTAGVYAIARLHPIFDLSEAARIVIMVIGAATLLIAGFTALAQTDIKRVIAYSTMSQIGYMFVAAGAGAYGAAMFHLATHAFFKALLFLGAGVVIHALADEQDIRRMGGLRRHMPKTWGLFLIGSLALAGVIPFAGFFSKDEILAFALAGAEPYGAWALVVYGMALLGALLTGAYSFRLLFLVFHGPESELVSAYGRGELAHHGHGAAHPGGTPPATHAARSGRPSEAPLSMLWPIMLLGFLTTVAGFLVIPGVWNVPADFLHQAAAAPTREALEHAEFDAGTQWTLALAVSLPIELAGIAIAWYIWGSGRGAAMRTRFPRLERTFQAAFGWDRGYDVVVSRPVQGIARSIRRADEVVVVPVMAAVARSIGAGGSMVGRSQNGLVRVYAFGTVLAVAATIAAFVLVEAR